MNTTTTYPTARSNNTPPDHFRAFLTKIGSTGLDSSGRPIGSTGGYVVMGQSDEDEFRRLQGSQPQQGNVFLNGAPATSGNPLQRLNETLGLSLGQPSATAGMRAAHEQQRPMSQLVGSVERMREQQQAYEVARQIQERGGLPQVGQDPATFSERTRTAEGVINRFMGAKSGGRFMPQSMAYMGSLPGEPNTENWRSEVIGAGGAPVAGYGGTLASVEGKNAQGGNRFLLKQNPTSAFMPASTPALTAGPRQSRGPSAAAMRFLKDGTLPESLEPARSDGRNVNQFMPLPSPATSDGAPYDKLVDEYRAGVSGDYQPEIVDLGDGVRVLKTPNGYQQLPQQNEAPYREGHVYPINGRQALLKGGRFIDTETGAPLYSKNAFGEDVENPVVFGRTKTAEDAAETGGAAPVATKPTKGQRAIQGGHTYEFDGAKWNAVNR